MTIFVIHSPRGDDFGRKRPRFHNLLYFALNLLYQNLLYHNYAFQSLSPLLFSKNVTKHKVILPR